jgi:hypothetical protein
LRRAKAEGKDAGQASRADARSAKGGLAEAYGGRLYWRAREAVWGEPVCYTASADAGRVASAPEGPATENPAERLANEYIGARMPRKPAIRPPAGGRDVVEMAHAKLGTFKGCPRRTIKFMIPLPNREHFWILPDLQKILDIHPVPHVHPASTLYCFGDLPRGHFVDQGIRRKRPGLPRGRWSVTGPGFDAKCWLPPTKPERLRRRHNRPVTKWGTDQASPAVIVMMRAATSASNTA